MENPDILRKKLLLIVVAAVLGAVLFDMVLVLDNLAYSMWREGHLSEAWHNFFSGLAYLLAIPAALVTPQGGKPPSAYVVNGLLGAFIFAIVASIWQFLLKDRHES
jgi:hypothetical protein